MIKLSNENLEDLIMKGTHLVDFFADWCGPCKMLAPVLESINEVNIIKINIDDHSELASKYRIMSIPTMIIFKDGEIKETITGFRTKQEILSIIEKLR